MNENNHQNKNIIILLLNSPLLFCSEPLATFFYVGTLIIVIKTHFYFNIFFLLPLFVFVFFIFKILYLNYYVRLLFFTRLSAIDNVM